MNMTSLDPELLRAFVAVADARSFTKAAGQLNRTQASVSLQIRRLEQRTGLQLFQRTTSRVVLAPAAESFLDDARRILRLHQETIARLSTQRISGRVRIGVMEDYGTRMLPDILALMAERFPLIEIEMEIGLTSRMLERRASFDAVIAMHDEGTSDGELICREQALWVSAPHGACTDHDPLPVALANTGCLFRAWAIDALNASGRSWRLAYTSQSLAAIEALAARGLAVTVVKSSMVPPGLQTVPEQAGLPKLPGAEIRLHRSRDLTPASPILDDIVVQMRARRLSR